MSLSSMPRFSPVPSFYDIFEKLIGREKKRIDTVLLRPFLDDLVEQKEETEKERTSFENFFEQKEETEKERIDTVLLRPFLDDLVEQKEETEKERNDHLEKFQKQKEKERKIRDELIQKEYFDRACVQKLARKLMKRREGLERRKDEANTAEERREDLENRKGEENTDERWDGLECRKDEANAEEHQEGLERRKDKVNTEERREGFEHSKGKANTEGHGEVFDSKTDIANIEINGQEEKNEKNTEENRLEDSQDSINPVGFIENGESKRQMILTKGTVDLDDNAYTFLKDERNKSNADEYDIVIILDNCEIIMNDDNNIIDYAKYLTDGFKIQLRKKAKQI